MAEPLIQVLTTVDAREGAERIARTLVERRLAACVQVLGPMESNYWWQGKIETTQEWICQIKTRQALYRAVEHAIKELHPYQVPEIVALPLVTGNEEYLEWIRQETV